MLWSTVRVLTDYAFENIADVGNFTLVGFINPRGAGGGVNITPLLTQKRRAVEIHGRRQSKARDEKVQMSA